MDLNEIIDALSHVGQVFGDKGDIALQQAITKAHHKNQWFTPENTQLALDYWHAKLNPETLTRWAEKENITTNPSPKTVGIIAAGNIPLVCLHDILSVLITKNNALVKLSSDDEELPKFFYQVLSEANPRLAARLRFAERIENVDAVIATGSNNTARYFEYYFGKYPHIIRKNRNSIAVLTGNETTETLQKIGFDITSYFGKGCRNVTQIWAPEGYDWIKFLDAMQIYGDIINHNKYANNYTYHKAILLMNLDTHLDSGFFLFKEDKKIYAPIGMLNYAQYKNDIEMTEFTVQNEENIQCIISEDTSIENRIPPGQSQNPELWEYADGVNTVAFLKNL